MSQSEVDYVARLITGEESLLHQDEKHSLDTVAVMHLGIVATNIAFEQEVRARVGEEFDALLRKRMRTAIPLLLVFLRDREVVYAISHWVHFIAVSAPALGIPVEEFTSMAELRTLWREAHLRSAHKAAEHLHDQGWRGVIASAMLAGIPPHQFGVAIDEANRCVDRYFGRNNLKRRSEWEQHQKEYAELRKLLAA